MRQLKAAAVGAVLSIFCSFILLTAAHARADEPATRPFDIRPQSLATALSEFARQSQQEILFAPNVVFQKHSSGLRGNLQPLAALELLLKDSGLAFTTTPNGAILVGAPPASAPERTSAPERPMPVAPPAETPTKPEIQDLAPKKSFWDRFRLAQAESLRTSTESTREPASRVPAGEEKLEEILVTAQKRSENIQDVPVSISAVTAEQLRSSDASQLSDIAAAIPGLQLNSQTGQPGSVNVTLRGITTADITSTTTAITVDDVPVGSSTAYAYAALSNIDLLPYDLDHVEVLKGPQGTLYGASSLGGLVKYVTTTPDLNELSGRVGGSASSIDSAGNAAASARASVNLPVVPGKFAVSVGGGHSYHPGYIDNLATGEKGFNDGKQDNARLTALWKPNDRFTAKLTGLYNRSDFNGLGGITYDPVAGEPTYGYLQTFYHKPFEDLRKTSLFIGDLSYDLGFATLTSVTGYSDMKGTVTYDASEIPFYKATFQANGVLTPGQFSSHTKRLSQEVRLASPDGQALQWLVGAFYNRERTLYTEHIDALLTTTDQPVPAFTPFYDNNAPSRYEEKALFTNLTYRITDAWDVGAGTRYSRNDQSVSADTLGYLVGGGGASPVFHSADHSTTWAVNSRFRINPDVMLYARVATGYRPGGANTAVGVPATFAPDRTTSYEMGVKSDPLGGRVHFNLTAFYIDWTSIQLTDRLANQIPFTGNAGTARSQGIELSSAYQLTQEFRLGAIAAYTDAKLESDAPAVGASAGDSLPNTPKWSGLVSLDWARRLTDVYAGTAGVAWRSVTSRESAFPFAQGGAAHLRPYDAVDLTAGVSTDRWRANVFVKNVANEHGYLSYSNFAATILQPRTLGLSVDVNF